MSNLSLWKRVKSAESADAETLLLLRDCCRQMGVRNPPDLLVTSAVDVPAAAGLFKHRILMPPGLLQSLSLEERRTIILHELAHIRRHDVAVNWVLALIQIVHWFNPILWHAFSRLRADREVARDAMVLSLSNQGDPRDYVRTLLKLTESLSSARFPDLLAPTPQVAVGMYGGKNGLKRRLQMIARLPQSRRRFDWTGPALSVVLVGALLTSAKSQTPPATQTLPQERHQVKVSILSEIPVLGRLFKSEVEEPATRPADPEKTMSLIRQSRTLTDAGKYQEALETVDQILRSEPVNDYATGIRPLLVDQIRKATIDELVRKMQDYWRNKEYGKARDIGKQILAIDPHNRFALGTRDVLDEIAIGEAVKRQTASINPNPSTPATQPADREKRISDLIQRSRDLADGNEFDSALDAVNEILRIDPTNEYATRVKPRLVERVESQRKAMAQLDRQLPALTFDAVGFSDVVDFLRDVSGANVFVNWKALEAAKVDRNTPVSANLRNIKFSKALSVILDAVGGGQTKLGYTVDDGVITISTQADLSRNVVVRVYDVRDLLVIIPDFAYTPDNTKPATAPPPPTREELVKQLTKTIMDVVSTDSWKDRGGSVGALRELEGQLIITQTPDNHRKIVALLEQLREERSIQVTVETRFVSCDHKLIDDLLEQWGQNAKKAALGNNHPTTRPAATPMSGSETTGVLLADPELSQFMKLIQNAPESVIMTSPRVTLWNGQRASVKVSSSRTYLSGYTPTTKGNGEVRYEPVVKSVDPGILLDLTATVSADRKYVMVSLHPQVTTLLGFDRVPWPGSPKNVDLMVQEPKTKTSEISTSISIPEGGSLLLSGLDDPRFGPEASGSPATQPASSRGIYLLVRPTIIRTPQAEQPNFPLLAPKAPNGSRPH
jgi:tetratricopeptide (TPR) repeat protein